MVFLVYYTYNSPPVIPVWNTYNTNISCMRYRCIAYTCITSVELHYNIGQELTITEIYNIQYFSAGLRFTPLSRGAFHQLIGQFPENGWVIKIKATFCNQ